MDTSVIHPTNSQIPVDLFVSKKHPGLPSGDLGFVDSSGNIVYKVTHQSLKSSSNTRVLLDATGNSLFTLCLSNVSCLSDCFHIESSVFFFFWVLIYVCFGDL